MDGGKFPSPSPAVNMPSGEPRDDNLKVSKVLKTDSTDGQTARSELLILCHESPERCSVPGCTRCHCDWWIDRLCWGV